MWKKERRQKRCWKSIWEAIAKYGSRGWEVAFENGEVKITPSASPIPPGSKRVVAVTSESGRKCLRRIVLEGVENWNHLCPHDSDQSVDHLCQHDIVLCSRGELNCKTKNNSTNYFRKFLQIKSLFTWTNGLLTKKKFAYQDFLRFCAGPVSSCLEEAAINSLSLDAKILQIFHFWDTETKQKKNKNLKSNQ